MMTPKLKDVLERAQGWPADAQAELAEIALEIEAAIWGGVYVATPEELRAIDEAERSGLASDEEVDAAFATFRGE
jgi:hypothetical protein